MAQKRKLLGRVHRHRDRDRRTETRTEEHGERDRNRSRNRDRNKDRKTAETVEMSKEAAGHEFGVNAMRIQEWSGQKDESVERQVQAKVIRLKRKKTVDKDIEEALLSQNFQVSMKSDVQ